MDDGQPRAQGGRWNVCGPGRERFARGPNHIWIWDSSGKLLDKIVCPERAVNCAFGGTQLRDLYLSGFGAFTFSA